MSQPEFSRPVNAAELDGEPREFKIAAEPTECDALAARFELVALKRLTATVTVNPRTGNDIVRVTGRFAADVVQSCVVTLEDVPAEVTGEFDRLFASPHLCVMDTVVEIDSESDDPPDPIIDGSIDIGEVVAEHMGLELDPFPRAPGVEFTNPHNQNSGAEEVAETRQRPFAILEKLKGR